MPQYSGVWSLQQQMQALTSGQWATDPLFDYTTLLLQGDAGANGAQNNVFYDTSPNQFAITRNGGNPGMTQGTFSPFSATGWANFFEGSSAQLSIANSTNLDLGSGNWTIEAWLFPTAFSGNARFFSKQVVSGNGYAFRLQPTSGYIYAEIDTVNILTSTVGPALNTWSHVAIVRNSNTVTIYLNGVSVGSASYSGTPSSQNAPTTISGYDIGGTRAEYFPGYISNLRFVKGTAVYTSNFTPSPTPLTAVTNTQLLTCQSNRFVDNSTNAFSITLNGTPSVQAFSPFAPQFQYTASGTGGSGYFDGTGDYLSVGSAANWTFLHNTTAAWTMEFWVYNTTTGSATTLLDTNNSTTGSTGVTVQKTSSEFINVFITYSSAGNNIVNGTSNITLKANAWNHVFISYNQSLANTNLVFYINGVAAGTANKTANTPSSGNPANALSIGCYGTGAGQFFPGYISSLRISNTVRSVPSGVPTAPYTSDANTALLTNFTNAGILDGTMKNNLETVGNAQVSTRVVKYGSGSLYFDGTTNTYLAQNPATSDLYAFGSGDFTIECWLYLISTSSIRTVYDSRASGTASSATPTIYIDAGTIKYYVSGADRITGIALATNQWYHVVVCRSGTSTRMFINGTQAGSTYTDSTVYINSSRRPFVGGDSNSAGSNLLGGYIDDLRVTKGIARYTQNFTPPSVALPRQ